MTKPTDKSKLIPKPKDEFHERPKWMRDSAKWLREKMERDNARKKAKQNEGIVKPSEVKEFEGLTDEEVRQKMNQLREGPLYK